MCDCDDYETNKKYVWFRLPYLPEFFIPYPKLFSPFRSNCSSEKENGRQGMHFKGFFPFSLTLTQLGQNCIQFWFF